MSGYGPILRRELAALLNSSLGLVCLVLFYGAAGFIFFFKAPPWSYNTVDLNLGFFGYGPIYLLVLLPLLALRTWADEYRGAMELLLTLPVRTEAIVLGKFTALTLFVWLLLCSTLPLPLTLAWLGSPDWAAIGAGYLALALAGALFAAIGLFFAALADNPIAGALATFLTCFFLYALGLPTWLESLPPAVAAVSEQLSLLGPYSEIAAGRLSIPGVLYFLTGILFFLALTTLRLQMHKWEQPLSPIARRHTLPALAALLLLAAGAWSVNVAFRVLRYDYIDLTANRQYTLAPQTLQTLGALEHPIVVRAYFNETPALDQVQALRYARSMLERYRDAAGGKLHLEILDPNANDQLLKLAANYGIPAEIRQIETAGEATRQRLFRCVQVLCGDRAEVFQINLANPGSLEEQLTVAIRAVGQASHPKIVLYENLVGARPQQEGRPNTEPGPTEALYMTLRAGGRFDIQWLPFREPIPAGTQLAIVHDPRDIAPETAWALQEFVRNGGALLICSSGYRAPDFPELRIMRQNLPAAADHKTTGLETLLNGWGLRIQPGLVVEGAGHRPVLLPTRIEAGLANPMAVYPLLLNLQGDCLNADAPFTGGHQRLHLNYASPIQIAEAPPEGIEYQWLVRTTATARLLDGEHIPVQPWAPELSLNQPGANDRFLLGVYSRGVFPAVLPAPPPDKRPVAADTDASTPASGNPRSGVVVVIGSPSFLHESWELRRSAENGKTGYEPLDLGPGKATGLQLYTLQMINRLAGAQDLLELEGKRNVARPVIAYAELPTVERDAAQQRLAWLGLLVPTTLYLLVGLIHLQLRRRRSTRLPRNPAAEGPA